MITTYFLKHIGENIFKHQDVSDIPNEYYIGLSSTAPQLDGTGVTEPTFDSGYSRVKISNDENTFSDADDTNTVYNYNFIYFPESILPWGTLTHYVIFDSEIDGNLLMYGEFNTPMVVPKKTVIYIPNNGLSLVVDNG